MYTSQNSKAQAVVNVTLTTSEERNVGIRIHWTLLRFSSAFQSAMQSLWLFTTTISYLKVIRGKKKWNVWVYPILSSEMLVHKIFVSVTLRYMGIVLLQNVIKLSFSLQIAEKDLKNTSTKTVAIQSIYTGMCWGAEVLNATPMYTEPGVAGPIFVPT